MENSNAAQSLPPAEAPVTTQNTQNGAQVTSNEQSGNAVKEAAQEAIRKHKLKVDGQEVEVDDEELKRGYTHQRAANKKLQEGLKAKKQAEEFISMMKDKGKLFEVIQKLGHNPRSLAEEYLAAQLEEEMLDPREKELREYKKKVQSYEEMTKQQKEAEEKKVRDELTAKFSKQYSEQIIQALEKTKLPAVKENVAKMAGYIKRAADMRFEMTVEEAAKLVKEDLEHINRSVVSEMDAETLVKYLGEETLQKIRTYDTSRLKDPNTNLKTPAEQGELNTRKKSTNARMSPAEWRKFNRGY